MKKICAIIIFCFVVTNVFSQQNSSVVNQYPKILGYISVVHPIVTCYTDGDTHWNFSDSYTVGFPMGVNILKSKTFGISAEITPFINACNGYSKVSNVLFHPGVIWRFPHGLSIYNRLAFETQGRYGFSASLSKVIVKSKFNSYFISIPVPVRFGNNQLPSIGVSFQVGMTF